MTRGSASELVPAGKLTRGDVGVALAASPEFWYAAVHAGVTLRIWAEANPARHDFVITRLGVNAPPGFELVAVAPNRMRRVAGKYFSVGSYEGQLWRSRFRGLVAAANGRPVEKPGTP